MLRRWLLAVSSLVATSALLAGCGSQNLTLAEPTIPAPLMAALPYRVAVQYGENMYDFTHREEHLGDKQWTIQLGDSNKRVYDQILSSLFPGATFIGPAEPIPTDQYDMVLRPSIQAFEFALPQQSRTDAYTVWIRYQIEVFNRFGTKVGTWPINAYGKSGAERFEGTDAIQRAATLAMRDAAALISMRLSAQAARIADDQTGGPNDTAQLAADAGDEAAGDGGIGGADVQPVVESGGGELNPTIESAEKLRDD